MKVFPSLMVALLTVVVAAPVMAASSTDKSPAASANGVAFGTAFCEPSFPCPSKSNSEVLKSMAPQVITVATACLNRELGSYGSNVFEAAYGLGTDLCLKTRKIPKNETGLTMIPTCCIKPVLGQTRNCQVVCTRYGVK